MKNNHQNNASQSAQLAVIAGLITILGDGLATVASILALQEAQQEAQQDSQNDSNNNSDLQKQIDDLSREIKQIKKLLRSKGI